MPSAAPGDRLDGPSRQPLSAMPNTRECTVLFADLRGSTSLYETAGNAAATQMVTSRVAALADAVTGCGGRVVKTLGDGLMAVFDTPAQGVQAADAMHQDAPPHVSENMHSASADTHPSFAPDAAVRLKLQVAMAMGEVVVQGGDCFGDAVNVAARLLTHAGDDETLVTAAVLAGLGAVDAARFRSLDLVALRGRAEPVHVHLLEDAWRAAGSPALTTFSELNGAVLPPQGIRLRWLDVDAFYTAEQLPLVLGRGADADCMVEDARVSRQHARIDAGGGSFQLVDLSYNGTYVRFDNDGEVLSLRRGACTLHGSGIIALGAATIDAQSPCIRFEVRR